MNVKSLLILLCLVTASAAADQTSVQITGNVATTCSFTGVNNGNMAINPSNAKDLGTGNAGGTPATVNLSYIGTPMVSVNEISSFTTKPSDAPSSVTFQNTATSLSLGPLTYSSGVATGTYPSGSTDTLTIGLAAIATTPFTVGSYATSTTVTCQ